MLDQAAQLRDQLLEKIETAADMSTLEDVRVTALGKKGQLTELMKGLGKLDPEERKSTGQALNQVKQAIAEALEQRQESLKASEMEAKLAAEKIDMSLPVRPEREGRIHPISQTIEECIAIFAEMGFVVGEGPDIENDWLNFGALNIPPEHPARQMHDTFYMPKAEGGEDDGMERVLRTHTSPVQIRSMTSMQPPIRVIAPGRTYRSDYDITHTPMFHQIEGIVIDKATNFGHLKGCLEEFCRTFFEIDDLPLRFRPSYFPFTEPSAEVDIGCRRGGGKLELGPYGDWLEILGSGMVHPKVIANCGLDPNEYQGFAFGMGIERIAMLKYGIPDLRTFFESDLRWLKHYGFVPLARPNVAFGLSG